MKIEVDFDECIGSGMCTATAGELFELDDDGQLLVLVEGELTDAQEEDARKAADVCPVEAIRLAGGTDRAS